MSNISFTFATSENEIVTIKKDKIMKATELSAHNYVVVFGNVEEKKTVWYYSNNTVRVVSVEEPMTYTEEGSKKVESFYRENLKCDHVQIMKFVDWQKKHENN